MKRASISREAGIVYFDSMGAENTEETLKLAKARASELGIKRIVVATTKGDTAVKAAKEFKDYKVVVVTHVSGFLGPGTQELTSENKQKIEKLGAEIFTGAHAFGGISHRHKEDVRHARARGLHGQYAQGVWPGNEGGY